LYDFTGERIPFRSSLESIDQRAGIFHENFVEHDTLSGDLFYHPIIGNLQPTPTAQYPKSLKCPILNTSYQGEAQKQWKTALYGLATSEGSAIGFSSPALTTCQQLAFTRDPSSNEWTIYEVTASRTLPNTVVSMFRYRITSVIPYSGAMRYVKYEKTQLQVGAYGYLSAYNWMEPQGFANFVDVWTSKPSYAGILYQTACYTYEAWWPSTVFNPRTMKEKIDMLVAGMMPGKFPIPDQHYGDLAMKASEKVNANHVNMIAFIRDLRRPSQLIPKLRNLRKLKGLANNFLVVKYGILPTFSDIEEIIGAFKRLAPYVDSNGFDTFSAGFIDTLVVGELHHTLEQHIKLAIRSEDSVLISLIARLDTMGTLPTFENLWDLIPYSFVIDWFIDVGEYLERVDSNLRLSRFDVQYATMSRRTTISGYLPGTVNAPVTGSVNWVHYHRWVSDQCPVPPLSLQTPTTDFNHWLESSALIIQRAKF
jgi:hypothetical protein